MLGNALSNGPAENCFLCRLGLVRLELWQVHKEGGNVALLDLLTNLDDGFFAVGIEVDDALSKNA